MSSTSRTTTAATPAQAGRPRRAGRFRPPIAHLLAALVALAFAASAVAQSVVVHPFGGQDLMLGAAVAERAAEALRETGLEVFGPEVAPTLIPPLVVPNGFLNPAVFLGDDRVDSLTGAELLRQTLGVTLAATGRLSLRDRELVLDLFVSQADGPSRILRLTAAEDAPEELASRVARALARELGAPRPDSVEPFDLSGPFGVYARAVTLVGAGFVSQARDILRQEAELPEAAESLLRDLEVALGEADGGDPLRTAVFGLAREDFRLDETRERFASVAAASSLPAAHVWLAVLAASAGDAEAAAEAFDAAADRYAYGLASRASWSRARDVAPVDARDLLEDDRLAGDAAGLLATALLAEDGDDVEAEKDALRRLGRAAPFFPYPFERLSFIAFDEDDALAAAEALAVAVELEPESDLYWTNLGWAYYLLGFLERSRIASERAIAIDPGQYIARYNLGLTHAVRDDLETAMPQYEEAVRLDPEVDDEAIADLENARTLYPDAAAVHYALGYLYAAEGRRAEAASAYAAYLQMVEGRGGASAAFEQRARRQVEALQAPPAPLEISADPTLALGATGRAEAPFHPADPLTPVFELYTPGEALPQSVDVTVEVTGPDGATVASTSGTVSVPPGAIGYVVDDFRVELPRDAAPGAYLLEVRAEAQEERLAEALIPFEVQGEPEALRWLLGRGITFRSLDGGTPLYTVGDLARPSMLPEVLVQELRANADAAAGAIPALAEGRFEGMDGGEVFRESTVEDVRAFLEWFHAQGASDTSVIFVEAYAQWVVDGTPSP